MANASKSSFDKLRMASAILECGANMLKMLEKSILKISPMKCYIKTYGCQMNHSDSERIARVLELAGYEKTLTEDEADLVVLNICSVRKSAVDRIAGNFKKYKKYKAKNPNFKTVITGCVLESDRERFERLFDLVIDIKEIEKLTERLNVKTKTCHSEFSSESLPNKNLIISMPSKLSGVKIGKSGDYKQKILKQVQDDKLYAQNSYSNKQIYNNDDYFKIAPKRQSKATAYAPIMTGCDNFCSYCVVPYTRGREYSRPAEEILNEIAGLVRNGYKEIILLGQNVNSYKSSIKYQVLSIKQDLKQASFLSHNKIRDKLRQKSIVAFDTPRHINSNNKSDPTNRIPAFAGMTKATELINFPSLLRLINDIPGKFWIRFLTSHPKDMTEELIKTAAECEKCAEYIHLALQSGDNEILKKMNRKYTAEHFLDLVKKIRASFASVRSGFGRYPAISTDIIVGFPGETEEQFQNTVKVMEEAKFDMAYLNKYSPRAGAASAKLDDDVSWEEKKNRENILNKVLRKTALENNQKYLGEVVEALADESGIKNQKLGIFYGRTRSFKNVKIGSNIKYQVSNVKQGQFVKIKITKAGAWGLEGEIAE